MGPRKKGLNAANLNAIIFISRAIEPMMMGGTAEAEADQ